MFATVAKSAKFANFQNFQLDNLVDFEKCSKNAYLLAEIGADTAENERNFAQNLPCSGPVESATGPAFPPRWTRSPGLFS